MNKSASHRLRFPLIARRVTAFLLDWLVYISYAFLLFIIVSFFEVEVVGPIRAQMLGFITLTFPVVLYGIILEGSKWKGTLGKKWMKIQLKENGNVVLRNVLKFLPWEIAHGGVHWIYHFEFHGEQPTLLIWVLLILPQLVVLAYFFSAVLTKGKKTLYDRIAGTEISYCNIDSLT